ARHGWHFARRPEQSLRPEEKCGRIAKRGRRPGEDLRGGQLAGGIPHLSFDVDGPETEARRDRDGLFQRRDHSAGGKIRFPHSLQFHSIYHRRNDGCKRRAARTLYYRRACRSGRAETAGTRIAVTCRISHMPYFRWYMKLITPGNFYRKDFATPPSNLFRRQAQRFADPGRSGLRRCEQ